MNYERLTNYHWRTLCGVVYVDRTQTPVLCFTIVDVTILDCIFVENMKTFFVLDMMCWKSHPIYDTEVRINIKIRIR